MEQEILALGEAMCLHSAAQFLEGYETPELERAQGSSLMGEDKAGEAGA